MKNQQRCSVFTVGKDVGEGRGGGGGGEITLLDGSYLTLGIFELT